MEGGVEHRHLFDASQLRSRAESGAAAEVPVRRLIPWARRALGLSFLVVVAVFFATEGQLGGLGWRGGDEPGEPPGAVRLLSSTGASDDFHGDASGCTRNHDAAEQSMEGTLCFLIVCFFACCTLEHWNKTIPEAWQLPISVVLFVVGMICGVAFLRAGADVWGIGLDVFFQGMRGASHLDPHAIFYILLPPLLYESASSLSWRVFRKVFRSAVILALPGVVLNTLFTGLFVRLAFRVGSGGVTWAASFLLASILSATDPVAVVAALHALGAPEKLATLIEGESLLNDGSAVVFFFVFLDMVATDAPDSVKQCAGMPPTPSCVVLYFLRLALGGPLLGLLVGGVVLSWICYASNRNMPMLEITIILTACYGTFFLAESIHVSGVLAVVTLGVVVTAMVNSRMSHDARHAHHIVVGQVGYTCNQVIFFAGGIISARFMWTDAGCNPPLYKSPRAWMELLMLYLVIHVTRALVVLIFSPVLVRLGYGVTWKEGSILVWGGLRGAVGLAMGLIVEHNEFVDERVSAMVAFHVSGIVVLTLLINGTTINHIYNKLELYAVNPFRNKYIRNVLSMVEDDCKEAIVERMTEDWFFQDIDFETIMRCVPRFSNIEFNKAGVPHPDDVEPVLHTLHALGEDGTKFMHDLYASLPSHGTGADRGKDETSKSFVQKLHRYSSFNTKDPSGHMFDPDRKDFMVYVVNSGDHRLEYQPGSTTNRGLYVSARPLRAVHASRKNHHRFKVTFGATENVNIIVGFCNAEIFKADHEGGEKGRGEKLLQEALGCMPYSVGLDIEARMLRYHLDEGYGETPLSRTPLDGDTVTMYVMRDKVTNHWKVVAALEVDGNATCIGTCKLCEGFAPSNMYPALQFFPGGSDRDLSRQGTGSIMSCISRTSLLSGSGPAGTTVSPAQTMKAGRRVSAGTPAGGRRPSLLDAGDEASRRRNSVRSQTAPSQVAVRRSLKSGTSPNNSTTNLDKVDKVLTRMVSFGSTQRKSSAKLSLSFEPQTASLSETTTQLFRVLFNKILHEYHEYHDHGLIGNDALAWLKESVGEAVDCTERELHHARAKDFDHFFAMQQRSVSPVSSCNTSAAPESPKNFKALASQYSRGSGSFSGSASLNGSMRRTSRRFSEEFAMNAPPESFITLFEPCIVEYLTIEETCSSHSWFDRFPRTFRRLGYARAMTKVESLWAFVEAHTKVIAASPALQRYPHLLDCLSAIVEEAKQNLKKHKRNSPRRFCYGKHFVALRLIFSEKLGRLQKCEREGWVSGEDTEALRASLWARVRQVDHFVPRIVKRGTITVMAPTLKVPFTIRDMGHSRSQSLESVVPIGDDDEEGPRSPEACEANGRVMRQLQSVDSNGSVNRICSALAAGQPEPEDKAWRSNFRELLKPVVTGRSGSKTPSPYESPALSSDEIEEDGDKAKAELTPPQPEDARSSARTRSSPAMMGKLRSTKSSLGSGSASPPSPTSPLAPRYAVDDF